MSANKTIKALHEQREAVTTEVRRLQQAIDARIVPPSPELERLVSGIRRALGLQPRIVIAVDFPALQAPKPLASEGDALDGLIAKVAGWSTQTRSAILDNFQEDLNESCSFPWYDEALADLMKLIEAVAPAPVDMPVPKPCTWTYSEHSCAWETECGESFIFMEDGPAENRLKFCPYCSKTLAPAHSASAEVSGDIQ